MALHILLGGGDGGELILRFLEGEHFLKFLLPDRVLTEGKAFLLLPYRIQLHQILCHLVHGTAHPRLGTGPFLGAQLVQLRCLGGIRRSILLDHIQAGGEHVQISAVPIGNLDVVLDGAVHLHLFNALIDSEPVGFMHHIVAHLQFGEILDLLAFKLPAAFLLFLLRPENVALRDDHEFQQGIFKAPAHMAVKQFHLSRLYLSVAILAVKACKAFRLQILRKPLRPGPGRGQKQHPAAVFLIPLQIRRQRLKAVVVGGHAFHIDIKPPLWSDEDVPGVHGRKQHRAQPGHKGSRLLAAIQKIRLSRQNVALFQPVAHALPKFQLHRLSLLLQPPRLVQKHAGIPVRKKAQKRHRILIKIADIAFQIRRRRKLPHLLGKLPYLSGDPGRLFGVKALPQLCRKRLRLRLDPF